MEVRGSYNLHALDFAVNDFYVVHDMKGSKKNVTRKSLTFETIRLVGQMKILQVRTRMCKIE